MLKWFCHIYVDSLFLFCQCEWYDMKDCSCLARGNIIHACLQYYLSPTTRKKRRKQYNSRKRREEREVDTLTFAFRLKNNTQNTLQVSGKYQWSFAPFIFL